MKLTTIVSGMALMLMAGSSLRAAITVPVFNRPFGVTQLATKSTFSLPRLSGSAVELRVPSIEERVKIAALSKIQA